MLLVALVTSISALIFSQTGLFSRLRLPLSSLSFSSFSFLAFALTFNRRYTCLSLLSYSPPPPSSSPPSPALAEQSGCSWLPGSAPQLSVQKTSQRMVGDALRQLSLVSFSSPVQDMCVKTVALSLRITITTWFSNIQRYFCSTSLVWKCALPDFTISSFSLASFSLLAIFSWCFL